jgi:hypothetical protein
MKFWGQTFIVTALSITEKERKKEIKKERKKERKK